jgi:hypothetical protein
MKIPCPVIVGVLSAACLLRADPPPSIVRIELPADDRQERPFTVPTEPEDTLEIDFPWPLEDWAGRGFTPDPEKYAGDFAIEATRGKPRVFVTPVAAQAHRVLHVVLTRPDGSSRSVPIELIPAPTGLAWHQLVFTVAAAATDERGKVSLSTHPPRARLREASPESEIGMIRTLRLMLNSTADEASSLAAANPALEFSVQDGAPRSLGDFTITSRYALRDTTTGTLGLCVSVANETARRLLFDPGSWVVRAGNRVYPVRTLDFPGELEPGSSAAAFLILTAGNGAGAGLLLPGNSFEVSAAVAGSANPRPVSRFALEGMGP